MDPSTIPSSLPPVCISSVPMGFDNPQAPRRRSPFLIASLLLNGVAILALAAVGLPWNRGAEGGYRSDVGQDHRRLGQETLHRKFRFFGLPRSLEFSWNEPVRELVGKPVKAGLSPDAETGTRELYVRAGIGHSDFQRWYSTYKSGPVVHKNRHYFDVYEQHFSRFRQPGRPVRMLEMGVQSGGSINMWKHYFGDALEFHGFDINPECKVFEDLSRNIHVHIGSQDSEVDLEKLAALGPFDIILDDAAHISPLMIKAFDVLYSAVQPDGVYLVEDTHAVYLDEGTLAKGSFMELCKELADRINSYYWRGMDRSKIDDFQKTTFSVSFYDSMVAFEKRVHKPYEDSVVGDFRISPRCPKGCTPRGAKAWDRNKLAPDPKPEELNMGRIKGLETMLQEHFEIQKKLIAGESLGALPPSEAPPGAGDIHWREFRVGGNGKVHMTIESQNPTKEADLGT